MSAPLFGYDKWQPVMQAAEWRCQCDGSCGVKHLDSSRKCALHRVRHRNGQGHCTVEHTPRCQLIAAPPDLSMSFVASASLAAADLVAWCMDCYLRECARVRRATRRPADEPDLFDGAL